MVRYLGVDVYGGARALARAVHSSENTTGGRSWPARFSGSPTVLLRWISGRLRKGERDSPALVALQRCSVYGTGFGYTA